MKVQHEYLQQASPGEDTWSLIPHFLNSFRYSRSFPQRIEAAEEGLVGENFI